MAAKDHLSPSQLRDHVNWHLERMSEQYNTARCADGNCWEASANYLNSVKDHGHSGHMQGYSVPDDVEYVPHHDIHFAVHVETTKGPYAVDLTHRQFNEKAPYPLVEPVERFEKRRTMKNFVRDDFQDYFDGFDDYPN